MTVSDIPRILSYAFKEGKRHGLILVSQDTREAQDVVIQFAGAVDGAQARVYQVAADDLEATNELDWAPDGPQVVMKESTLSGFASGQRLSLPKASITSIEWQEQ
jgi:alpha-L-arabinofuranosidase